MIATLKDISRELWLRMRDSGEIVVELPSGDRVPMKNVSDACLLEVFARLVEKRI